MSSDIKLWFSADDLAKLSRHLVIKIPTSARQCRARAKREEWPSREVRGKGGPRGQKTEFRPPDNILAEIQEFLSENPEFFSETKASPARPIRYEIHQVGPLIGSNSKPRGLIADNPKGQRNRPESIYIAHYTTGPSGITADTAKTATDQVVVKITVNAAEWRSHAGLDPEHIKVIDVQGDSMKPTLQHGDQVLVDTTCNRFIDDAIYAIQQSDRLRIKRIKLKLDGSIEVKSDNHHGFGPETYSKEEAAAFNVFGRILPFKFGKFDL